MNFNKLEKLNEFLEELKQELRRWNKDFNFDLEVENNEAVLSFEEDMFCYLFDTQFNCKNNLVFLDLK